MITSISDTEIVQLLIRQLTIFFSLNKTEEEIIKSIYPIVKDKVEYCFKRVDNKYFYSIREGGEEREALFNPFHSVQYCIFLYFYSRIVYTDNNNSLLEFCRFILWH